MDKGLGTFPCTIIYMRKESIDLIMLEKYMIIKKNEHLFNNDDDDLSNCRDK